MLPGRKLHNGNVAGVETPVLRMYSIIKKKKKKLVHRIANAEVMLLVQKKGASTHASEIKLQPRSTAFKKD